MAYKFFNDLGLTDVQVDGIKAALAEKTGTQIEVDDKNLHFKIFGVKDHAVDRALLVRMRSKRPGFHFIPCVTNKISHERLKLKAYLEDQGALQWRFEHGGVRIRVKNQKGRNPDYGNVFYFVPEGSYSMVEIYDKREDIGDIAAELLEKLKEVDFFSKDVAAMREANEAGNPEEVDEQLTPTNGDRENGSGKNREINELEANAKIPSNLIVFGAPGTGKSYRLEDLARRLFNDAEDEARYERVTFYPTYSYAQFVGTYKPVMVAKQGGGEEISYKFVPGPFLRVLVRALNEPLADGVKKDWCLIIEEINRANAAAVFGDVFQLLDRNSDGVSEYAVAASEDVKKYLIEKVTTEWGKQFLGMIGFDGAVQLNENGAHNCNLRIPSNMYIWSTMNSADQGVSPMDTAFKRRWSFEYIGIDDEARGECLEWTVQGHDYRWNDVRRYVNGLLMLNGVNEDKLMGPYFIKPEAGNVVSKKSFASKVLMYLWEDAGRMIRRLLFGDAICTYSQLVAAWNARGIGVFSLAAKRESLPNEIKVLFAQPAAE